MKKIVIWGIVLVLLLPACARKATGSSVVIKPKTHARFFNKGKDRYKKRTKLVRMKS